jgi:hypothetical protein
MWVCSAFSIALADQKIDVADLNARKLAGDSHTAAVFARLLLDQTEGNPPTHGFHP